MNGYAVALDRLEQQRAQVVELQQNIGELQDIGWERLAEVLDSHYALILEHIDSQADLVIDLRDAHQRHEDLCNAIREVFPNGIRPGTR